MQARQTRIRLKMDALIDRSYQPIIKWVLQHRTLTCSACLAIFFIILGYTFSGRVNFTFRPSIETPFVQAEIEMPAGTPTQRTREVAFQIEQAARTAIAATGEADILIGITSSIAERSSNGAEVSVRLVPQSERKITAAAFAQRWRESFPELPDVESIFFDYLIGPGGSAEIDIQISHPEVEVLRQAATEVAEAVGKYPGVEDVRKGFGREMPEYDFDLTPEGQSLGITARELGQQIRHAFYGAEALRQPLDRDELRVMVKLPERERNSLSSMQNMLIRVPGGGEIPLNQAARIQLTDAPARITRVNGARVINVTANVVPGITSGNKVLGSFQKKELPTILTKYPELRYSFEGEQREQREAMHDLSWGLLAALFAIYAIMASILRSYLKALIILLMLPLSLAGAVMGHVLMGFDLSVFSIFGMIALCGMVVNGALVLELTRAQYVKEGKTPIEAIQLAAQRRFRPILLTAVTTFLGLGPMIFETSIQALFLVPMAIALGVGTLVAAILVLTFIPAVMALSDEGSSPRHPL